MIVGEYLRRCLFSIATGIVTLSLGKADLAEGVPITSHKQLPERGSLAGFLGKKEIFFLTREHKFVIMSLSFASEMFLS